MINYIDFNSLPKYKKKLSQVLEYDEYATELKAYFKKCKKYSYYSLALHFNMSDHRFTNNYLKSKDKHIQELTKMAINAIAAHALENEDDYAKSLRFILARQNTGKDFIELSDEVKEANNQIVILPAKDK